MPVATKRQLLEAGVDLDVELVLPDDKHIHVKGLTHASIPKLAKPTSDNPLASTTPLDVTCLTARQAKYSDVSSASTGWRWVATLGVNDCSGSASRVCTRKPPSRRL